MKTIKLIILSSLVISLFSCEKEEKVTETPIVPAAETPINAFDSINLGNHNSTEFGSFLNLKTGTVYSLLTDPKGIDNQSNVDLVYYYNNINHTDPFLGAPTTAGSNNATGGIYDDLVNGINLWTVVNNTEISLMQDVSTAEFNNIDNLSELKAEWGTFDIGLHYEYAVSSDKIYRFKTFDNKIGLLKINTIVGSGQTIGTMNVSVKVQQ
jgi:hypothetical protein